MEAANTYGTHVPPEYEDLFADLRQPPDASPQSTFLLDLADVASQAMVPQLIARANDIVSAAALREGGQAAVDDIYDEICAHVVPARNPVTLPDILNAGWKAFHDPNLWEGKLGKDMTLKEFKEKRDMTLKELLLKSIEVLEFTTRVGESR